MQEPCRFRCSFCSWELAPDLGSGADLTAGRTCQTAERQNDKGAEYRGSSPMGVPEFGLRAVTEQSTFTCCFSLTSGRAIHLTRWEINIPQIARKLLTLAYFLSIWLWWRRARPRLAAQLALSFLSLVSPSLIQPPLSLHLLSASLCQCG